MPHDEARPPKTVLPLAGPSPQEAGAAKAGQEAPSRVGPDPACSRSKADLGMRKSIMTPDVPDATKGSAGFGDLALRSELLQALTELGYEEPTPIQREAIPLLLEG